MVLVLFAAGSGGIAAQSTGATIAEKREFFESRIRPVLVEHCYTCHNASVRHESDLAVDSRDGLLAGGDGGAVLVPGKPAESRLLLTMRHQIADLEMPEGQAKLSPEVLVDFEKWIAEGAYDPRDDAPTEKALSAATSWESTFQRRKDWWCYQPISNPDPPDVADPKWNHHAIDRFLASRWAAEGLSPSDPASAEVLIRRLFINLIGLPPSMEEFQTWTQRIGVEDSIQKRRAMEELVDHLLQRPQFGERWARHWMDWIRYADSHGSEGDPEILGAWQYRDYLIRAINQDVPVDQLMIEHVAGDLLEQPRVNVQRGWNESIIGTAHWRMVFHGFAPTDALDEKVRFVDDQINAFSKAFLGQTVSCARCHDHKFDAIGQQDYYALFSVLAACRPGRNVVDLPSQWNQRRQELKAIKPKIREALANDWLEALPQLRRRLQSVTPERKDAEANDHLLHLLFLHPATTGDTGQVAEKISTENTNGKPDVDRVLKQTWRDLARRVKSSRQKHWDDSTTHWNLTNGDAIQHVTMTDGLPADSSPGRAGQFAVATEPGQAIAGIFPSGIVSHTVSSKSPSRLTSVDVTLRSRSSAEKSPNPDAKSEEPNDRANADPLPDGSISIGADQVLWLQVIGDGGAMSRYVVQDYPRNGTVYPVTQLKPTWRWIRYDLSYWNGDKIHVECSTAGDAPLLAKNNARSWYGIRAAVFAPKSHPSPPTSLNHLAPLFAGDPNAVPENRSALIDHYVSAIRRCLRAWRENQCSDDQALMLDACLRAGLLPNDVEQLPGAAALVAEYQRVENEIPIPTRVPGIDRAVLRRQPLYVRGNHKQPAEFVNPRFLKVIDAIPYAPDQDPRRRLAQDLVRSDNPLTRRVMVNRIWHHLFGSGIVSTPDNFGRLGSRPSHPRLLDHLATQFADDKWSLKKLIRRIVTSRAWQLDSVPQNGVTEKDPENRYLSHSHLRRMTAEAIRDQTLMVSGQLDPQIGGPPVAGNSRRRSVYVRVKRNDLDPLLRVFDFPQPL
ncbi:MAG: PSD1 and planctomycete cytochrome C domain-containing protein, partial [Planctomycetota bacterium]